MTTQSAPRINQKICDVLNNGSGLIGVMNLWLQQTLRLLGRNPINTVSTISSSDVGPSPYKYINNGEFTVTILVSGGTVSAVSFSRDGVTFYQISSSTNTNMTLNPGDSLLITYSVAPTLTLIPR